MFDDEANNNSVWPIRPNAEIHADGSALFSDGPSSCAALAFPLQFEWLYGINLKSEQVVVSLVAT